MIKRFLCVTFCTDYLHVVFFFMIWLLFLVTNTTISFQSVDDKLGQSSTKQPEQGRLHDEDSNHEGIL